MTRIVPQWGGSGKATLVGWAQPTRRPAGMGPAQFYDCLGSHRSPHSNERVNMEPVPGTALVFCSCEVI